MAKAEKDVYEIIADLFEKEAPGFEITDEELLGILRDSQSAGKLTSSEKVLFVTKLSMRMNESEEFKNQVDEIIKVRIQKKTK